MIFAFSPARFFRFQQIFLTTVQWIPFSLAFLYSYLQSGRRADFLLAIAFFTLQAITSGHGRCFSRFRRAHSLRSNWRFARDR